MQNCPPHCQRERWWGTDTSDLTARWWVWPMCLSALVPINPTPGDDNLLFCSPEAEWNADEFRKVYRSGLWKYIPQSVNFHKTSWEFSQPWMKNVPSFIKWWDRSLITYPYASSALANKRHIELSAEEFASTISA